MMTAKPLRARRSRLDARRSQLLACAAVAAVGLALQPTQASAQAFQGTIGDTSGTVTRTPTGSGTETITIGSPTAIIDWTPGCAQNCSGTFDFLPSANTATFEGAANFAVLNRIAGPATIELNGTIISDLQGSPGTRTGTLLFQTPGGFIIGPSAVLNVGSLVLTSLDVATVGEGGSGPYFDPTDLSFSLGSSSPTALVYLQPGSQVNAPAEGSFIAMVSPRVDNAGAVSVNGAAAYIAAEQVDVTVNAGLFDIVVASGTTDSNGVIHSGSTTGPASTGGTDNHGIYFVAIPKNQALEVFLLGSAGFAPPVSPTVENGVLVLSAGFNVAGGQFGAAVSGAAPATFNVLGGSFTSDVRGVATDAFILNSASSSLDFDGDVAVRGVNSALLNALNNFNINFDANLNLAANDIRNAGNDGSSAIAGTATVTVNAGSTVTIAGNANIFAIAQAAGGNGSGPGGNATGGDALVFSAGTLNVGGTLNVNAFAFGGAGLGQAGGNAIGGDAQVGTSTAGSITFGNLNVFAGAIGGNGGPAGGAATAGTVQMNNNGTITGGSATFNAIASGGTGAAGGDATGGFARIFANAGSIDLASLGMFSGGVGGAGATNGGSGNGGVAQLFTFGGNLSVTGNAGVFAGATGGAGTNGTGGAGLGGLAELVVRGGNMSFGVAQLGADGTGGAGAIGGAGTGGFNASPIGQPPTAGAFVSVQDGTLTAPQLFVTSRGIGGNGTAGAGGAGVGGEVALEAWSGTTASLVDIGIANLSADANGGQGGTAATGAGGAGGVATGGAVFIFAETVNAELRVNQASGFADATGGTGGAGANGGVGGRGGDAQGGFQNIGTVSGRGSGTPAGSAEYGVIFASSDGSGGAGGAGGAGVTPGAGGDGGNGTGGTSILLARGGSLTAQEAEVSADGFGGTGGAAGGTGAADGLGGEGTGGEAGALLTVRFQTTDPATVNVGSFNASTEGEGGSGRTIGVSRPGSTSLEVIGSSATFAELELESGTEGDAPVTGGSPTRIRVEGGTVTVTTAALIETPGDILFDLIGSGVFNAQNLASLSGGTTTIQHSGRTGDANSIGAGAMSFTAGGVFTAAAGTQLGALSSISVNTTANAIFAGGVFAPVINFRSADIDLASTATIGDEDDRGAVNLTVAPNGQQTVIGGDSEGPGYTLTQAEAERIEAESVTFTAGRASSDPAREPDVLIRDLLIAGSDADGPSSVTLTTEGTARVVGDLEYRGAAEDDTLAISAAERLEVITPDGSITVTDANDNLSGQLQLSSSNIVVADADLAARLAEDSEFDGRDEALRTNGGAVNEAGYLQAGGIGLFSGGNIFVQNTGTATNFAGLTVGGGGLLIGSVSQVPGGGGAASFRGTLITANDVLTFEFTINSDRTVTLRSYSYAGGTNAAGEVIPAGGFDPILALFNAAGALIGQNDDGGSNVPADPVTGSRYDVFLQVPLTAGSYRVTVTAFSNFANGPNLSDGFEGDGNFNQRSSNFAFDVLGADSVTGPGQQNPTLTLVAFGRRQNADGTFTGGRDFFGEVDFGTGNGVTYTDLSEFNGCFINNGCGVVAPPPNTTNATVLIATLEDPGSEAIDDGEEDGGPTFGTNFVGIVDTGNLSAEQLIDQAVLSGGDSTAWGEECAPDEPECEAENEGPVP